MTKERRGGGLFGKKNVELVYMYTRGCKNKKKTKNTKK